MDHYWYKGHYCGSALLCTREEIKDWAVANTSTLEEALAYLVEGDEQVHEDMAQGGCSLPFAWEVRWGEAVTAAAGQVVLMIRDRDQEEEWEGVEDGALIFDEGGRMTREALEVFEELLSVVLERGDNAAWRQIHNQLHAHLYGGGDV